NQGTPRHTSSARSGIDRPHAPASGIGGLNSHDRGSDSLTRDQDGVVTDTLVLSSQALNEFRFQASQRYNNIDPTPYSPIGTPAISRPSGHFRKATKLPQWRNALRFQFVDNFSLTRRSHDLKFGADISVIRGRSYFPRTNDGSFVFATDKPFDPNDLSTYPTQYTVEHFDPYFDLPNELYGFFAQDSWRVGGGLTLNLGVRYDLETAYRKINGLPDDTHNVQPRIRFVRETVMVDAT